MSNVPLPQPSHSRRGPYRLCPSHPCTAWEGHAVESQCAAGSKPGGRLRPVRRVPWSSPFALRPGQGRAEDFWSYALTANCSLEQCLVVRML